MALYWKIFLNFAFGFTNLGLAETPLGDNRLT